MSSTLFFARRASPSKGESHAISETLDSPTSTIQEQERTAHFLRLFLRSNSSRSRRERRGLKSRESRLVRRSSVVTDVSKVDEVVGGVDFVELEIHSNLNEERKGTREVGISVSSGFPTRLPTLRTIKSKRKTKTVGGKRKVKDSPPHP